MTEKKVTGVYAAVLTPRRTDDSVDVNALGSLIEFLITAGITKFAMNGATGEFCLTTPAQLRTILTTVQDAGKGKAEIICGVGAPGSVLAKEFVAVAEEYKVKSLLLPMPCFFPYQQEDLGLFCRDVAESTKLPILLYNLPQFTSGLEKETVRQLITDVPNIIGIKDSSGSLEILRDLTVHGIDACRIVGNDSALAPAMLEGLCDGVVSGVAGVLPELILAIYGETGKTGSNAFAVATQLLDEFIGRLDIFPTPWGLKWVAEFRGILTATFSQPITAHRREQSQAFALWLKTWLPAVTENNPEAVTSK